jgi:nucleotide-binding universal stress UspA family protein
MKIQHIIAPVDVDPTAELALAERAVDEAAAIAAQYGAKLTLVYVADPAAPHLFSMPDAANAAYRAMQDVMEARVAYARRTLSALVDRAKKTADDVSARVVTVSGSVPQIILDVARDERADLIAISTHARRGAKRFFLGSVAERTAHLAHIPVLLLPPR